MNKNKNFPYAVLSKLNLSEYLQLFAFVNTYWTYWKNSGGNNPSLTDYRFYFDVYYSQDLANNYSSIQTYSAEQTNHEQSGEYNITSTCFTAIVDGYSATSSQRTCYQPANAGRQEFSLGNVYHTVYHNSDGTKTITWNGRGRRYASNSGYDIYTGNKSITLPTIPRYATISSFTPSAISMTQINVSWSVSANCSAVYYSLDNGSTWSSSVGTGTSGSFSITSLTPGTTYPLKLRVTRSDSGLNTDSLVVNTTTIDVAKISNTSVDFDIDTGITINFTNPSGKQVDLYLESPNGTNRAIRTNITSPYTLALSESDKNVLFNLSPTSKTLNFRFRLKTDVNASYISYKEGIATISNANPLFDNFTYEDTNATTLDLTGNNQSIIKGYSNVKAIISTTNKAVAQKGATMVKYRFVVGEKQIDVDYSDSATVELLLNAVDNNVFLVYAIDSRGNSTVKQISPSTYFAYTKPTIKPIAVVRNTLVDTHTTLSFEGSFFVSDFGSQTNAITATYRYRESDIATWTTGTTTLTTTATENTYVFEGEIAGDLDALGFNLSNSYVIEVLISDKLSSNEIKDDETLSSGKPNIAHHKNGNAIGMPFDETIGESFQIGRPIYVKTDTGLVPLVEWEEE